MKVGRKSNFITLTLSFVPPIVDCNIAMLKVNYCRIRHQCLASPAKMRVLNTARHIESTYFDSTLQSENGGRTKKLPVVLIYIFHKTIYL